MMHWICTNGFADSDVIVRPAIMSMVDRAPKSGLAAARRGGYYLRVIQEQTTVCSGKPISAVPDLVWQNLEIFQMSKKGITGHDEWVVTEALATALVALEQLPPKHQPRAHMDDIKKLLAAGCQPGTLTLHIAQAKCRLFPDVDPLTIYREYGLEDGQS
jgi:hypothetical protein